MSFYYQNVRGLRTKCRLFRENLMKTNYDIIAITESWLNESIYNGELFDDRYHVFRRDRLSSSSVKSDGGGACIAINKTFCSKSYRRFNWETNAEDLWVTAIINDISYNFCCVYLPGDLNIVTHEEYYNKFCEILIDNPNDKFVILGDFNVPGFVINYPGYGISATKFNLLKDFINFSGFHQFNGILNNDNRLLDLILSNVDISVSLINDSLVNVDSCHPPLLARLTGYSRRSKNEEYSYRDFNGADYDIINSKLLEVDWMELLSINDINEMVDVFYLNINDIISNCVRLKTCKKSRFPFWYQHLTTQAYKNKLRMHKRWKKNNCSYDYYCYSQYRASFKQMVDNDYSVYITNVENDINSNIKKFWKFIKKKRF